MTVTVIVILTVIVTVIVIVMILVLGDDPLTARDLEMTMVEEVEEISFLMRKFVIEGFKSLRAQPIYQ